MYTKIYWTNIQMIMETYKIVGGVTVDDSNP